MIPAPTKKLRQRGPLKHRQTINLIACSNYACSNGVKSVSLPMQNITDLDKEKNQDFCGGSADNTHYVDSTDSCIGYRSPYNFLFKK